MRTLLFLLLANICLAQSDCIIDVTAQDGSEILVGLNEVKIAYENGDGSVMLRATT